MANVSPTAAAINKLAQPEGMRRPTWLRLKQVLRAIDRYQPSPYPGVRRLARDTRIPFRTVARLIVRAEELGLITRSRMRDRDTFAYVFTVPTCVPTTPEVGTEEEVLRTSSSSRKRYSGGPEAQKNMYRGPCCVCGFAVQPWKGLLLGTRPVHRQCEVTVNKHEREHREDLDGPSVAGADPETSVSRSTRPADPAVVLAQRFDEVFNTDALRLYPQWKGEIFPSHRGAVVGYVRKQMLPVYTPEHVEAFFDAFYDELLDPNMPLEVRPGQFVWQRFVGWWGTVAVPDPRIKREHDEYLKALQEGVGRQLTWLPNDREADSG